MKRCPDCDSLFPDTEQFCELDGTPLVRVDDAPSQLPRVDSHRALLPIGVVAGVLLGVLLSLLYFTMSRQPAQENSNTSSSSSSARQPDFLQPQQPAAHAVATASVEPSVEPSPSPSTETPSPQISAHVDLSSSDPTAGGARRPSNPVIITLNTGATIEADEAWQTGEGIWYRKHGVVSLLDPKNVKAVDKAPAEPLPSATKSPSP